MFRQSMQESMHTPIYSAETEAEAARVMQGFVQAAKRLRSQYEPSLRAHTEPFEPRGSQTVFFFAQLRFSKLSKRESQLATFFFRDCFHFFLFLYLSLSRSLSPRRRHSTEWTRALARHAPPVLFRGRGVFGRLFG